MKKGNKDALKALVLDIEKSLNAKAEYLRGAASEEGALIAEGEMSELAWVWGRLKTILDEKEAEDGSGKSEESAGSRTETVVEAGTEGRKKVGEEVVGGAEGGV